MDINKEINQVYNTRNSQDKKCIDILIDILGLIDPSKLLNGENHTRVNNNLVLEIVLQNKIDEDRIIILLFQGDFLEIHFDSYIKTYEYSDLIDNNNRQKELRELITKILGSTFKHVEYYHNNELIKYSSIWNKDFLPTKTIYLKPFGRIKEKLKPKKKYLKKELKAESFLREEN